jgi:hypothetical protein
LDAGLRGMVEMTSLWRVRSRGICASRHVVAAWFRCHHAIVAHSKGNPAMAKNQRLVLVGGVLIALAIAFFLFFLSIASKSNNPAELMRVVGTVSGVVGGIGVAMIVFGKVGRKT